MSDSGRYLAGLIAQCEHEQLDFKFAINDSKKIARTIAAFANTAGGRLLIGVNDNGNIVGASSNEEYYMIEAAAGIHCKPAVSFEVREWQVNDKTVLEIIIKPSKNKPVSAPDKDGKMMVYIRVHDQNLLANSVLLKVWRKEKEAQGTILQMEAAERFLLQYLSKYNDITKSKFARLACISQSHVERILVNLVSVGVLKMTFTENQVYYSLKDEKLDEGMIKKNRQVNILPAL
jgi:predicted HTH transcriptional regulator